MPRHLKVFTAQLGFYDTVVAVPSQAAALKAWGTRMNMFADGTARPADDPQAIEAALAHPGVPLKRGIGTGEPFSLNPGLPRLPDLPPPVPQTNGKPSGSSGKVGRSQADREKPKKTPPPPPDRSALEAAESRLAAVEQRWRDQESSFDERRAALDGEQKRARAEHDKERRRAEDDHDRERVRYDAETSASMRALAGR